MYVDSHVHLRDFEEKAKETISHGLRVAEDSGLSGIFCEPNTTRPITTERRVLDVFEKAREADSKVFLGVIMGLTPNKDQVREAVDTYRKYFPKKEDKFGVVGFKTYLGESTGDLAVIEYDKQKEIYSWLEEFKFGGLSTNHCERKSSMEPEEWNPKNPISHCDARPEESETDSVKDLIQILEETGYARKGSSGRVQVEHVSVPESVWMIQEAKKKFNITASVAPRHLLLNNRVMEGEKGLLYKVNPPLREEVTRWILINCFLKGEIDMLATDHSPHLIGEKTGKVCDAQGNPKYLSGAPELASWPEFTKLLIERGATQELLDNMAYRNVNKIFGTQIPRLNLPVKPGAHLGEYAFDAYAGLK